MFCLRSWLPLLFIPTNASPAFIVLFFISTYFLHRPCIYCSVLLFILFVSSCHWSDHCFFDFHRNWFEARHLSSSTFGPGVIGNGSSSVTSEAGVASGDNATDVAESTARFVVQAAHSTATALLGAAAQAAAEKVQVASRTEWTGLGMQWIRSLLGRRMWRLPCVDVWVRL